MQPNPGAISATSLESKCWRDLPLRAQVMAEVGEHGRKVLGLRDIAVESFSYGDWQSGEDPSWQQMVIRFDIRATAEDALVAWDDLSTELRDFIDVKYPDKAAHLHQLLSVTVRWT